MWVSYPTRPEPVSQSQQWAIELDMQICYHCAHEHVARALGTWAIEQTNDAHYHTGNILVWCARSFLCRIHNDDFEPGDIYLNFIENNYGADIVHEAWVAEVYWSVHTCITSSLPGYNERSQYDDRLAVPIDHVDLTAFHKLRITTDAITVQRLRQTVRH